MKLSFIIPVYNGREFIVRCLDSIINLAIPEDDYEIIVVDDCSSDETREIVNNYIVSKKQVRLICQLQNHRQGAARNRGLIEAKGDYIAFVDADDIVLSALKESYILVCTNHIDMVYGYMEVENKHGMKITQIGSIPTNITTGAEFAELYYNQGVFLYPPSYIYRKQFLIDINGFFIEDRQHEDRDWLAYVLAQSASVIVNPKATYRYCYNPNSTCRYPKYSTVFDHVASGIRHINLSKHLADKCPNMSQLLYALGEEEIYKSLRLRNLTKYPWTDNRNLYDEKHLCPLIGNLKHLCKEYHLPFAVRNIIYGHLWMMPLLMIACPIASTIRKIKHR
ncbi:MAG: glycosyltransferase family 2 protein [Paludibacteraceae bacterium]|nr:glycosyltransferase family 2 protein [Paludibacteraceae bacterium]